MNYKTNTSQRGSVILYGVIMVAIIMTTSLAIMNVLVVRNRVVSRAVYSSTAISGADSAVELCLYEARQEVNYDDPASTMNDGTLENTATFTIENLVIPGTFVQSDCSPLGSQSFSFRAVGTFQNTSRALEVSQ